MLGRTEEPELVCFAPKSEPQELPVTWTFESMHPWDLSWQTSPRIWSATRFVSKLTFWTWAAWRIRSELEDLTWDATLHPYLELWNTGCKTRFPCWSEVHILWPLSLTELLFPVPLPEPAGGPPWWKTPPFSIICRTQRDIFGRSFHAVKILLEVPASRDWFLDLYVVVQSERRSETANRQEASELTALKPSSEGAGIPRPLRFRVDLEICARRRPLRPEAHEVAGLAERSPEDTGGRRTP